MRVLVAFLALMWVGVGCSSEDAAEPDLSYNRSDVPPRLGDDGRVYGIGVQMSQSGPITTLWGLPLRDPDSSPASLLPSINTFSPMQVSVASDHRVLYASDELSVLESDLMPWFAAPVGNLVITGVSEGPDGQMFAVDQGRVLHAWSAAGDEQWSGVVPEATTFQPAVDRLGRVAVQGGPLDAPGFLAGFDVDGARSFVIEVPALRDRLALGEDQIYVTHVDGLTAYDHSGAELWTWQSPSGTQYAPIVARNGNLVVSGGDGLYFLDPDDGSLQSEGPQVEGLGAVTLGSNGRFYGGCAKGLCILSSGGGVDQTLSTYGAPVIGAPALWQGRVIATLNGIEVNASSGFNATYGWSLGGNVETEPTTWSRPGADNGSRMRQR